MNGGELVLPEEGMFSAISTISNHVSDVTCLAANHQYLVSGSLDRTVRVYRLADFSETTVMTHHTYHVRAVDFSPSGRYLATCASDGFAMIFDTESSPPFSRVGQCQHPSRCDMRVVAFANPHGERVVTGGDDGTICVWSFSPQQQPELTLLTTFGDVNESIHACRFVPYHDDIVISGSSAGDLRLWRLGLVSPSRKQAGNPTKMEATCHLYLPSAHDLGVTTMDIIARRDDPMILMATGGHDNLVCLWHVDPKPPENPSLKLIASRKDHNQSILSLRFSRNDSSSLLLASSSIDPTVVIYIINRADSGKATHKIEIVQRISDHIRYVNCANFSFDTGMLFTGSNDHTIRTYAQNQPHGSFKNSLSVEGMSSRNMFVALPPTEEKSRRRMLASSKSVPVDSKYSSCPSEFTCPITQEIMTDPVIASDGYTYEKSAITAWFNRGESTSPMTNDLLPHRNLIPNITLRSMIQRYMEEVDRKANRSDKTSAGDNV